MRKKLRHIFRVTMMKMIVKLKVMLFISNLRNSPHKIEGQGS